LVGCEFSVGAVVFEHQGFQKLVDCYLVALLKMEQMLLRKADSFDALR